MATTDSLRLDISTDLERIDSAMTRVILDPSMSQDFRHDPNGTLIRVGMHPPASAAVNDRVNRTFYAAMTNSEMNAVVLQHFSSFTPSNPEKFTNIHLEGLDQGKIQNSLDYDLEAADHLLTDRATLTKVLSLFLHDLNRKRILLKTHDAGAIDAFVASMVEAILQRKPISEHPVLEEWDRNYGVGGFHFGAEAVEVGPVATAYTAVELGLFVTVAVAEAAIPTAASFSNALAGDRAHMIRLATTSKILQFRSDLMLHAYQFEGRRS